MSKGCEDPDSALELFAASAASPAVAFVHSGPEPNMPRFMHAKFAAAVSAALPSDPELGPLAAAAGAGPAGGSFVLLHGLLYRRSPRSDSLCIPAAGDLRRTLLQELHATPLRGHFGRDKTRLSLARRSVWWPGLPTAITEYVRTCPTCQRVKAEHLPPAGPLFPFPVPSRRLDFMELPTAVSGHDFLQVHIDLLTGRVWLVPTFRVKTATAEVAARNFVGSVFHDVGLLDIIVSDRDTHFTGSFCQGTALHAALGRASLIFADGTALHAALGRVSLIFGSPHHHNTTSKVERGTRGRGHPRPATPIPPPRHGVRRGPPAAAARVTVTRTVPMVYI
jgi:hypothetical protein